jgi:hypothetical protein
MNIAATAKSRLRKRWFSSIAVKAYNRLEVRTPSSFEATSDRMCVPRSVIAGQIAALVLLTFMSEE